MAKFKIGDRVSFVGCKGEPLTGVVTDSGLDGSLAFALIAVDGECGYHAVDVVRYYADPDPLEQVTLIDPRTPKPKTIPARSLSGKHIGRVVTAESISGSVGVTATLEAVTQESEKTVLSFRNGGVFNTNPIFLMTVSPESEVIVK